MEASANIFDINRLDKDVLLPPRKRLLAGLKKQNLSGDSHSPLISSTSNEFESSLNSLLGAHMTSSSFSAEDIAEASKAAALAAAKAARAARAAAQEKAAIAVKAIAAAKSALELVASLSEEPLSKQKYLNKDKLKKHVRVQVLYKKHQPADNYNDDEEFARELHRNMNSSPRISKKGGHSSLKSRKHKKPKILNLAEKAKTHGEGTHLGNTPYPICNGRTIAGEVHSEGSNIQESRTVEVDKRTEEPRNTHLLQIKSGNLEETLSGGLVDMSSAGRRRGRIKLKKLPLSVCALRDQGNPEEELSYRSSTLNTENKGKLVTDDSMSPYCMQSSSSDRVISLEESRKWKCQALKAPESMKQSEIMQS